MQPAIAAGKINHYLERFIPVTTPLAIIIGFLIPDFFIFFRPYVMFLFGLMTFSGALKLKASELGEAIRSPVPILIFFITAHVLMPVIALFVSSLFFVNADVVAGFVLLFAGPTAVSGFIWVSILKGDMALCLTLILLDTLLAPLVVPGSISILMGENISMEGGGIAFSLLMMIVIPTIIGVSVNEASKGKIPSVICPYFDPAAKICLMAVIATNASIIAPVINLADPLVWQIAILTVVLTFAGFILVNLASAAGRCRAQKNISLVIAGGLRNNSAIMTIAVAFFPEAAVLPTLMSIIIQQSVAAVMGKFLKNSRRSAIQFPQ